MLNEADVNEYAAGQLLKLRTSSGLSQTHVAREMNMSSQQLYKYECGINRLSISKVMQFAEVFDVSVTVFFPKRDRYYSHEPVPPATMRFIRLIGKINAKHYDLLYVALKAIARLSGSKGE